jgi:hypothetical protein
MTAIIRIGQILTILGAGMWLASYSVQEDWVSRETIANAYRESYRFAVGAGRILAQDSTWIDRMAETNAQETINGLRWATRNRIRCHAMWIFWPGVAIWCLFFLIRKEPVAFDNSLSALPNVISSRIPYFLLRWRWKALDSNGQVVQEGLCRTIRGASRSASSAKNCARAEVAWESGYEEYEKFLAALRRVTRPPTYTGN